MEDVAKLLSECKLEAVAHRNTEMLKTVSENTTVAETMTVCSPSTDSTDVYIVLTYKILFCHMFWHALMFPRMTASVWLASPRLCQLSTVRSLLRC
jgi:hypothetical protein